MASVHSFQGIPFAAPPTGELRWVPPQPFEAWDGVRAATSYMPHCIQIDPGMRWFELGDASKGCLTLNAWSPATRGSEKLPAMVWIHGSH